MGPLCAVWVHILFLTIHFWTLLIWFFNVTKNQNRTSRLSWKVGGGKKCEWFMYDFFPAFHIAPKTLLGRVFGQSCPLFSKFHNFLSIYSRELIQIYVIGLVHGLRCHQQAHKYVHTSGTYGLRLWYIRNFIFLIFFKKCHMCLMCAHTFSSYKVC